MIPLVQKVFVNVSPRRIYFEDSTSGIYSGNLDLAVIISPMQRAVAEDFLSGLDHLSILAGHNNIARQKAQIWSMNYP